MDVDSGFEHGVLVDTGLVGVADAATASRPRPSPASSPTSRPARDRLRLTAYDEARLLLLGGEPLGEPIVMWWNFVGRSHEEIVAYREEWQAQIAAPGGERPEPGEAGGLEEPGGSGTAVVGDGQDVRPGRFGVVTGEHLPPIPAPALPNARLKERR